MFCKVIPEIITNKLTSVLIKRKASLNLQESVLCYQGFEYFLMVFIPRRKSSKYEKL